MAVIRTHTPVSDKEIALQKRRKTGLLRVPSGPSADRSRSNAGSFTRAGMMAPGASLSGLPPGSAALVTSGKILPGRTRSPHNPPRGNVAIRAHYHGASYDGT